ncbi:MAG: hypothetical protein ACRD2J_17535, partial [Thermoanaerobaculia bacterium]
RRPEAVGHAAERLGPERLVERHVDARSKVKNESDSTRSKVQTESNSTRTKIEEESTTVRSEVEAESLIIQEKIDALELSLEDTLGGQSGDTEENFETTWDLQLRLAIEANLLAGEGNEMAVFQLPAPHGYLETVRDLVRSTIEAMAAVGENVGQAPKFFAQGEALMIVGQPKEAFEEFQKAYRQVVK